MASEAVLKELFQVAKGSRQFAGMSDKDIWNACLAYKDRSEEDMRKAMENIRNKDQRLRNERGKKQEKLELGKEKMIALHQQEAVDHKKDERDAEKGNCSHLMRRAPVIRGKSCPYGFSSRS